MWDINPILAELNYARRKNFLLFLSKAGFLPASRQVKVTAISDNNSNNIISSSSNSNSNNDNDNDTNDENNCNNNEEATASADNELSPDVQGQYMGSQQQLQQPQEQQSQPPHLRVVARVLENNALCRIVASYL